MNDDRVAAARISERTRTANGNRDYVLEGALEHKDSMGNGRSSARRRAYIRGTGVAHSEFNASRRSGASVSDLFRRSRG